MFFCPDALVPVSVVQLLLPAIQLTVLAVCLIIKEKTLFTTLKSVGKHIDAVLDVSRTPTEALIIHKSAWGSQMIQIQALKHHRRPVYYREERRLQQIDSLRPRRHDRLYADENKIQTRRSYYQHVLLVQKQAIELQAMAEMLNALDYRVTPVEESGKALLYFGREPCEVVISELDMPQFNGFELAKCIRRHSPRTRILLMTACCQAEVVDYMDGRVVDGWLFKPFGIDVLKSKLQGVRNPEQEVG